MEDFAEATAVAPHTGRLRARLSSGWEVWGPNGGYVATVALRAAGAVAPFTRPASLACHFLAVAESREVDLDVVVLRKTRRAASLRVSMTQDGRPILEAIVWAVDRRDEGVVHDAAPAPDVPRPEALQPIEALLRPEERAGFPFWDNLECRPIDWSPPPWRPQPPVMRRWLRFRPRATFPDDPFLDAGRAVVLLDTHLWGPAWLHHGPDSPWIAPSLDLAVQFHRTAPHSEWLLCEAVSPAAAEGLVGARAALWDSDGRLLASGAGQLFCKRGPGVGAG
jgi:acyl-CoA thioesterase II